MTRVQHNPVLPYFFNSKLIQKVRAKKMTMKNQSKKQRKLTSRKLFHLIPQRQGVKVIVAHVHFNPLLQLKKGKK